MMPHGVISIAIAFLTLTASITAQETGSEDKESPAG